MIRVQEIASTSFSYDLLTEEQAVSAKADAVWVREQYATLETTALETSVAIGRRLLDARERIGHGHFLQWVEKEFNFGVRNAQKMMQVTERFGENTKRVSHLPQRTVYLLAAPSTPEAIREEVLAKPPEQAPTFDQLRDLVKDAKASERKAREVAKMPAPQRKRVERQETAKAKEDERWREEQRRDKDAAVAAVARLQENLGDSFAEIGSLIRDAGAIRFREALIMALDAA